MHLVTVCTGKTHAVEIQGATIQTAYLKSQVRGPCFIGHAGPEGNETAVHPDTVYAIAREHYDYWAQRLGSQISQSGYGYFAENLTIAGLDEQALHVGDVQLGSSLGLDLPFSCRSGYCGTCQCRIVEGEVRYEYAPLCDAPPGHALLCCARPASPTLILDA